MGYARRGVEIPPDRLKRITLAALRPTIPDLMYVVGIPPDIRQNLGRWMSLSSTEIYTRDHRTAVTKAWEQLTARISSGAAIAIPDLERRAPQQAFQASGEEMEHLHNDAPPRRVTQSIDLGLIDSEEETVADFATQEEDSFILTPRLILNIGSKVLHWTSDFEPDDIQGTCLGCGWEFSRAQVHFLHGEAEIIPTHHPCKWAFKKYTFPATWTHIHETPDYFIQVGESSSDSGSTSESEDSSMEEEESAAPPEAQVGAAAPRPPI